MISLQSALETGSSIGISDDRVGPARLDDRCAVVVFPFVKFSRTRAGAIGATVAGIAGRLFAIFSRTGGNSSFDRSITARVPIIWRGAFFRRLRTSTGTTVSLPETPSFRSPSLDSAAGILNYLPSPTHFPRVELRAYACKPFADPSLPSATTRFIFVAVNVFLGIPLIPECTADWGRRTTSC